MPIPNDNYIPTNLPIKEITQSLRDDIPINRPTVRLHINAQDLPELLPAHTLRNHLSQLHSRRRPAPLQPNSDPTPALPRFFDQGLDISNVRRDRPLYENVFPLLDAGQDRLEMLVYARVTNHQIDIRVVCEIFRRAIRFGVSVELVRLDRRFCGVDAAVEEGYDAELGAAGGSEQAGEMGGGGPGCGCCGGEADESCAEGFGCGRHGEWGITNSIHQFLCE